MELFQVLACMHQNTPRDIFLVLENPSPQLGTFPMSLETSNTYAQAPSNESIPTSYLQGFSKIMDESHAHAYRHKINKKFPSEQNTYLAYVSSFGSTGVRLA